jgi:hypothetical protein
MDRINGFEKFACYLFELALEENFYFKKIILPSVHEK